VPTSAGFATWGFAGSWSAEVLLHDAIDVARVNRIAALRITLWFNDFENTQMVLAD